MERHRNKNLRKVCACARRSWAKCPHPWHVNIQWQGQNVRKSLDRLVGRPIRSRTEAEAEFDAFKVRLRAGAVTAGRVSPAAVFTLREMLDRYQRDYLSRLPSARNTRIQIDTMVRVLLPHEGGARAFGAWPVNLVTEATLWAYKTAREVKTAVLAKDGRPTRRAIGGTVTVNRDIQLLRRAFNWATAALPAEIASTPFPAGRPPKGLIGGEVARSRRLESSEAERLLAACGTSLRPLVEAALETGCRLGELLGLQWRDVSLRESKPEIRLPGSKTKTRTARTVPISARLRPILEMRRHGADGFAHAPDAYVFGHVETGERITTIKTGWRLALKRAGIVDLHFHDLRREAASRWLDAGIPLNSVSKILGHTTTEQTATYLACVLNAEHDAIAEYDAHRRRLQESASRAKTGGQNGPHEPIGRDTSPQESSASHVLH